MLTKTVATEFKVLEEKREIEGYASVFGNIDHHGDIVHKGSFKKTLKERLKKNLIKVRQRHVVPIGRAIHAKEDSTGLHTVSKISRTPAGDETLILAQDGVMDRMSIGYRETKWDDERADDGQLVHNIREVMLLEWSFTDLAANEEATVTGVKSLDDLVLYLKDEDLARRFIRQSGIQTRDDLKEFLSMLERTAEKTLALEDEEPEPGSTDDDPPSPTPEPNVEPSGGDEEPEPELIKELHSRLEHARMGLRVRGARRTFS